MERKEKEGRIYERKKNRTLSDATAPGQSGAGSNSHEGVLSVPQSSSITGAPPSDCLVSYLGHSLGKSYPSAEKQSVYSAAPLDCAKLCTYTILNCLK